MSESVQPLLGEAEEPVPDSRPLGRLLRSQMRTQVLAAINTGVVAAKRYQSGDPFDATKGGSRTLVAVPLDPDSVATAFPSPFGARVNELRAMQTSFTVRSPARSRGGREAGLMKMAEAIIQELNMIGVEG